VCRLRERLAREKVPRRFRDGDRSRDEHCRSAKAGQRAEWID
jgi:hypothetical protein